MTSSTVNTQEWTLISGLIKSIGRAEFTAKTLIQYGYPLAFCFTNKRKGFGVLVKFSSKTKGFTFYVAIS